MKKALVVLVSLSLLFSGCSKKYEIETESAVTSEIETTLTITPSTDIVTESTIPSETEPDDSLPEAYAEILNDIYYAICCRMDGTDQMEWYQSDVQYSEILIISGIENQLDNISYTIVDIDDNGIEELLVLDNNEYADEHFIINAYTLVNNNAVLAFCGGQRSRYYLLEDMTLYHEGSDGAAYNNYGFYSYENNSLIVIEQYFTGFRADDDYSMEPDSYFRSTEEFYDYREDENSEYMGPSSEFTYPDVDYYEYESIQTIADWGVENGLLSPNLNTISEDSIPDQYNEVLTEIYDFIISVNDGTYLNNSYVGMGETSGILELSSTGNGLEDIGYVLIDIDDNGTDELLILATNEYSPDHYIPEMYTIVDGNICHISSSWNRCPTYLLSDMTVFHCGTGGAAYNYYEYYDYSNGELDVIELYFTGKRIDDDSLNEPDSYFRSTEEFVEFRENENSEYMGPASEFEFPEVEFYIYDDITTMAEWAEQNM